MTAYLGGEFATDNHTHGLKFQGIELNGNPGARQLITDIWLLNRFRNLNLDLVLNPLTARLGLGETGNQGLKKVRTLGLAERVLTFGSLYDITGVTGPYHPCVEEVRGDPLLVDFRLWMNEQTGRLDNYDIATIEKEVDAGIRELTRKNIRKYVDYKNIKETTVKIAKDELIGKIPGGSALITINDAINHNREAAAYRYGAFIALTRDKLDMARSGE